MVLANRLGQKWQPKGSSGFIVEDFGEIAVSVLTNMKPSSPLPLLSSLRRLTRKSSLLLLFGKGVEVTGDVESTSSEYLEVVDEGGVRQTGWYESTDT